MLIYNRVGVGCLRVFTLTPNIVPAQPLFPVNMQHHVIVITHDCVGGDIDGVDAGQHQQAVFDPLPAMLETAAAVTVLATQKCAAYAA